MIDPKVNRILLLKLRTEIIRPLNDLVEWDRYGIRNDDSGFIFGWIKRDDGSLDFVSVTFRIAQNQFLFSYTTSSKKYSKEIADRLSQGGRIDVTNQYLECEPASDIPEANLVDWQKELKVLPAIFVMGVMLTRIFAALMLGGANAPSNGISIAYVPKGVISRMAISTVEDNLQEHSSLYADSTNSSSSVSSTKQPAPSSGLGYDEPVQMVLVARV